MDRVTENLVESYCASNELDLDKIEDKFELFCNFCIVSKEYEETFDNEQVWIGEDTVGIDGLAIIVNGRLIDTIEEIDDLLELNKYLEVTFIFIQSKTSSNFDMSEIGDFLFAVSDFFNEKPRLPRDEKMNDKAHIMNHIYLKVAAMTKGLPICKLYYITTGIWKNEPILIARFETGRQDLLQKNFLAML